MSTRTIAQRSSPLVASELPLSADVPEPGVAASDRPSKAPAAPCPRAVAQAHADSRRNPQDASSELRARLLATPPKQAERGPRRIVRGRSYLELFPQRHQAGANPSLNRAQWLSCLGRDFSMCESFKVGHLQRASLCSRHTPQRSTYFLHG